MEETIIDSFDPQIKLAFYKFSNKQDKLQDLLNSLGFAYDDNTTLKLKVEQKEANDKLIEEFEKDLESLLEILKNSESDEFEMNSYFVKKTLSESNFSLFLNYINTLFNSLKYTESKSILSNLIKLIDRASQSNIVSFIDYSQVKIISLWKLVNVEFMISDNNSFNFISSCIEQIKIEIQALDLFNNQQINSASFSDSNEIANHSFILSQIPVLKGYLIIWSVIKFYSSKTEENFFKACESFIELALSAEYYPITKSFEYLIPYLITCQMVLNKKKYEVLVTELVENSKPDNFNSFISNILFDFDVDEAISLKMLLMAQIRENFFFSSIALIIDEQLTKTILKTYCSLFSKIDFKKIQSLDTSTLSTREVVKRNIILNNFNAEIIKEDENELIYKLRQGKVEKEITREAKKLQMLTDGILSHFKN